MRNYRTARKSGFTLVEILIVVIILGILAAIVIPQFTNASTEARQNSTTSLLQTIRSQVELYKLQHGDTAPDLSTNWDDLTTITTYGGNNVGPYLQSAPRNPLNQQTGVEIVATDAAAAALDPAATSGFVFSTATGKIWATNADLDGLVAE